MENLESAAGQDAFMYRVFISYAHEDKEIAAQIAQVLEAKRLRPIWDKDIRPGFPFTDAIADMIAHTHIFMPIITENSQKRPWVHQETGYAKALNIPILPIAYGLDPGSRGDMIAQLQAVPVQSITEFAQRLDEIDPRGLILPAPKGPESLFEFAHWPETRTERLAHYANWVADLWERDRQHTDCWVRLQATASSFSIPEEKISDPIWTIFQGKDTPHTAYLNHLQREERLAMERCAKVRGCKLLIYPAALHTDDLDERRVRCEVLLKFLQSKTCHLEVALAPVAQNGNLAILGDYFYAESQTARQGYWQTLFNFHAPSVLQHIHRFDEDFKKLRGESPLSLEQAIDAVAAVVKDLRAKTGAAED